MNKKQHSIIVMIIVGIILLISLACGSTSEVKVIEPTTDDQPSQQVSEQDPTKQVGTSRSNPAPLGSTILVDDMEFKVLDSTRPATKIILDGNMFNTEPEPGQEYILVKIEVSCKKSADDKCNISIFNMKLLGSEGITHDSEFVAGVDGLLEDNEFYGGSKVSGSIPFIINSNETDLLLVYEPFFGDAFYLAIP